MARRRAALVLHEHLLLEQLTEQEQEARVSFIFVRLLIYLLLSFPLCRSYRSFILWFPYCRFPFYLLLAISIYLLFCRLIIQVSSIFQLNAHFCLFIHSWFVLLSVFFVCPALSSKIAHALNIDGSSIYSRRFVICSSSTQHFKSGLIALSFFEYRVVASILLVGSQCLIFCRLLIQVSSIFQLNAHFCLFIHSWFVLLSIFFVCPALSSNIAHALNYIDGSSICSGRFVICSSSTQHFKLLCSLLIQVSSLLVSFNFSCSSLCSFAPSPSIYVNN